MRMVRDALGANQQELVKREVPRRDREMAKDPVCGMEVDEKKATATSVYHGLTYYFCTQTCKKAFEQAQEKYVGKERMEA